MPPKNTRVFILCEDEGLARKISALPSLHNISRVESNKNRSLDEQLEDLAWDIAIVDVSKASHAELDRIADYDRELIFLSDGKPNEALDAAMLKGVSYHFRHPYDFEAINEALSDYLTGLFSSSNKSGNVLTSDLDQFGLLVGSSNVMRKLYRAIRRVAPTDANVLIVGESGTGKELVAQTLHLMSDRSDGPFVAVNCGALSPDLIDSELFGHVKGAFTGAVKDHQGIFSQAESGTVFLDEITEMPVDLQVKLLRVLEQEEYKAVGSTRIQTTDVRIVSATNRNPYEAIEEGRLREDLYFRLAQFPIEIPPLRSRREDVLGLAKHFIAYLNKEHGQNVELDDSASSKIEQYDWPGNVRELKHCIERSYLLADNSTIKASGVEVNALTDTPPSEHGIPTGVPLEDIEKIAIQKTLDENDGNKKETAEQLGISVKTLYNKIEKYS